MGKLATSPLPYRGAPPLQSGGQNQKWPTSGQGGYLTPAVPGSPTAAERGGKSEVAHKWANWLPHPCRIGEPHRHRSGGQNQKWPTSGQIGYLTPAVSGSPTATRAGGKIRSGPQVGKLATSPLPYRGAPPLQSGGQNQKWPTSGQSGYLTLAVSGSPTATRAGGKIRSDPQVGKLATSPLPYRGAPPLQSGGQNQKWPQVGKLATSPLPYRGAPPPPERGAKSEVAHKWANWLPHPCRIGAPHRHQSGGQNQKWPTSGQIGYLTPAVSGSPTATGAGGKIRSGPQVGKLATSPLPYQGAPPPPERGAKSEVAHNWANWLPHPCRIGEPHRHQSGGQNQKWPTSGQIGYLTPAVSGSPTATRAGSKIRSGPQVGKVDTSPLPYRGAPPPPERGAKSEVAHKWAKWIPHLCHIGEPRSHQSGGQNREWPTSGKIGYLTPAVSGSPTAAERGAKSEVTHKWANWLPHPCRIREPHRHQSGGQNQKWPTTGQIGYLTPAASGSPTATRAGGKIRSGPQVGKLATSPLPYRGAPPPPERGAKSEVAHKWAKWIPHLCHIGEPHRHQSGGQNQKWPTSGQSGYLTSAISGSPEATRAGGKIGSGPQVGKLATSPLPYQEAPPLQSGGQNQKWPTSGQIGYLTPAASGNPTATRAGGKIRSGPQVGKLATSPLPYRGAPPPPERGAKSEVAHKWAKWIPHLCHIGEPHLHQSGGQNQKWPTSGQIGYLTPAVSGSPNATRAGGKIRSGPQVGKLATSPLPYRGAPPLQSGGQNQKWLTSGQIGYLTPAASGSPTATRAGGKIRSGPQVGKVDTSPLPYRGAPPPPGRGAKSEVAHKWANWLPHPCRIGEPHRHQSGGQNQKWPTSGQIGYLTPAVSGSPTASEQGAKSEVAHKWAKWPPHPCRIGEPHRFRAGGKIRTGAQKRAGG